VRGVNLFLYMASVNASFENHDTPTRNADGTPALDHALALPLHAARPLDLRRALGLDGRWLRALRSRRHDARRSRFTRRACFPIEDRAVRRRPRHARSVRHIARRPILDVDRRTTLAALAGLDHRSCFDRILRRAERSVRACRPIVRRALGRDRIASRRQLTADEHARRDRFAAITHRASRRWFVASRRRPLGVRRIPGLSLRSQSGAITRGHRVRRVWRSIRRCATTHGRSRCQRTFDR
jgi:hypothetical protein